MIILSAKKNILILISHLSSGITGKKINRLIYAKTSCSVKKKNKNKETHLVIKKKKFQRLELLRLGGFLIYLR